MTMDEIKEKKDELFNEDFSIKKNNTHEIVSFCNELTKITGIQCCTIFGCVNELLPKVYNSVIGG